MNLNRQMIDAMDSRYRAALINSLSGFKSANLVGTADHSGHTNLAVMSSAVHLGSHPPLMLLVVRPGGTERHTLSNILETGVYTLNHVGTDMIEAAHQTAARYDKAISEFDVCGLTPLWQEEHAAPFVNEAVIGLAMKLREHQSLPINGTHLVIGEVVSVRVPQDCIRANGSVDLCRAGSVALSGLDSYHRTTLIKTMAYAKPELPPRTVDDRTSVSR